MKISMENAIKNYESRIVLDVDNLVINKKGIYAILGSNGSGKSTLIECIGGLNKLTSGRIIYDINDISMMTQKNYLFDTTVISNITKGLKFRNINEAEIEKRIKKYIDYFDVHKILKNNAKGLSGGEGAKIAFLRTIILETEVVLFDEPTASMDMESTLKAEELIVNISNSGKTVIMVTHDLFQAERIADYIIFMDKGKIIEMGDKISLFSHPKHPLIKILLNKL